MIIKGGAHSGRGLADYLTEGKNANAQVLAIRGDMPRDLAETLEDWRSDTHGSQTSRPLYHASLNPDRALSREEWEQALAVFEKEMGFENQPRALVLHNDKGREHVHAVYSRIDHEQGKAISDSWNYLHHEKAARAIERELGLERTQGALYDRDGPRPDRTLDQGALQQGERLKMDARAVKAAVSELYRHADTGPAFVAALEDAGYVLAQGDKRGYVILDRAGGVHSLARASGAKAGALREALRDFPAAHLPTVREARERQRAAVRTVPHDLAQAERQEQAAPRQGRRKKEGLPRDHFGKRQAFRRAGRALTRPRATPWRGKAWRPPRAGARPLPVYSPRHAPRSTARCRMKPAPRVRQPVADSGHVEPIRPPMAQGTVTGCAAMWEEYPAYKAAGLLHVWRERWRAFLPQAEGPRNE